MTDRSPDPQDDQTTSGRDAITRIRDGQSAQMATIVRCRAEIQEVSVDRKMPSRERQTRVRQLQRLRNQANQALRDLEDDELAVVAESDYAKDAVTALKAAAKQLNDEVSDNERISNRVTEVAGAIDGVTSAADLVLSQVIPDA